MVDENSLSGTVKLDLTDFKTGISELNRQVKLAESGFRSISAGMDDWSATSEGLEARQKSLTTVIGLQQQKVALLTTEYEKAVAEEGADSRAAEVYQIRINNETAALQRNQLALSGVTTAIEGNLVAQQDYVTIQEEAVRWQMMDTETLNAQIGTRTLLTGAVDNSTEGLVANQWAMEEDTGAAATLSASMVGLMGTFAAAMVAFMAAKKGYDLTFGATEAYDLNILKLARDTGNTTEEMSRLTAIAEDQLIPIDNITSALDMLQKRGLTPSISTLADVSDKFLAMGDSQERTDYMVQLLGKNWTTLINLFVLGGDKIKQLAADVEPGKIVLQEQADNAELAQKNLKKLEDQWESLRNTVVNAVLTTGADTGTYSGVQDAAKERARQHDLDYWTAEEKYWAAKLSADQKATIASDRLTGSVTDYNTAESYTASLLEAGNYQKVLAAKAAKDAADGVKQWADATRANAAAQQAEADAVKNTLSVASGGIKGVRTDIDNLLTEIKNMPLVPLEKWAKESLAGVGTAVAEGLITPAQATTATNQITDVLNKGVAAFDNKKPINIPAVMDFSKVSPGQNNSVLIKSIIDGKPYSAGIELTSTATAAFVQGKSDYDHLQNKTVTITENIVTNKTGSDGSSGNGGSTTGHWGKDANGDWIWIAGKAAGGIDIVVPAGHPNDSAAVFVSSGEHVVVTPANQVSLPSSQKVSGIGVTGKSGATIGGDTISVVVNDKMAMAMFLANRRAANLQKIQEAMK